MRKLQFGLVGISSGNASVSANVDILRELFADQSPSIQQSDLPPTLSVHSMSNQVEFILQPGRAEIKEMSRDTPFNQAFPAICANIVGWLSDQGVEWRTHGWNAAVTFDVEGQSSGEFLRGLLSQSVGTLERDIIGASVELKYHLNDISATLKLEPRFGKVDESEVFVLVNYHREGEPTREANEVLDLGNKLWNDLQYVVQHLVERRD